jgi:hypothetical protein
MNIVLGYPNFFLSLLVPHFILSYQLGQQCRPSPLRLGLTIGRRAASMVVHMTARPSFSPIRASQCPTGGPDRADRPIAWRLLMTGRLLDPAHRDSESWRKLLFVHSYGDSLDRNAGGRPGQVGGRQAQVPEQKQMPDSEVDAGKSDSDNFRA